MVFVKNFKDKIIIEWEESKVKKIGLDIETVKTLVQRFRGPIDSIGGFHRGIIKCIYLIIYIIN